MKYALVRFIVHILESKPFVVYTDHASLLTATESPYPSQRISRWLFFFAELNFGVKYTVGNRMCWRMRSPADLTISLLILRFFRILLRIQYVRNKHTITERVGLLHALGSDAYKDSEVH